MSKDKKLRPPLDSLWADVARMEAELGGPDELDDPEELDTAVYDARQLGDLAEDLDSDKARALAQKLNDQAHARREPEASRHKAATPPDVPTTGPRDPRRVSNHAAPAPAPRASSPRASRPQASCEGDSTPRPHSNPRGGTPPVKAAQRSAQASRPLPGGRPDQPLPPPPRAQGRSEARPAQLAPTAGATFKRPRSALATTRSSAPLPDEDETLEFAQPFLPAKSHQGARGGPPKVPVLGSDRDRPPPGRLPGADRAEDSARDPLGGFGAEPRSDPLLTDRVAPSFPTEEPAAPADQVATLRGDGVKTAPVAEPPPVVNKAPAIPVVAPLVVTTPPTPGVHPMVTLGIVIGVGLVAGYTVVSIFL